MIIQNLIRFQLNIYTIILLVILYLVIKLQRDIYRFSSLLLDIIIGLTIIVLVIEPLAFIFDGRHDLFGLSINLISNYGLILIAPILTGLWASYLDYKMLGDRNRLKKRLFYQHGSILVSILCVVNMFTPFFFYIDANDHFRSGPFQWVGQVIVYIYFLSIIIIAYRNRKYIRNSLLFGIITFFALPIFGTLLQMFNAHLFFAWTMMAMAIIIVYILLETTTGIRDFLTKLYSRRALENYITNLLESKQTFRVMMLDLNSFKLINDRYGHLAGDQLLVRFAEILSQFYKNEKMIARLGGDEFFMVFEKLSTPLIVQRIIETQLFIENDPLFIKYNSPGFAWGLAQSDISSTIDSLFMQADHEMYLNKRK